MPIDPLSRLVAEGVGDELFLGERKIIDIPLAYTVAGDADLAGLAEGRRLQIPIEQINLSIENRLADRH